MYECRNYIIFMGFSFRKEIKNIYILYLYIANSVL